MDIIMRFRVNKIALAADIEKAFLMVSMAEEDRDALRFLWVDDITKDTPEIITLRFTRIVFGVSASPFLLNATIRHHINRYFTTLPEVVQKISRSIYVDDIVYGADHEDSAYELYADSKCILKEAGFNLRKFVTNSVVLSEKIGENERILNTTAGDDISSKDEESYTKTTLGITQPVMNSREQKILGVMWDYSDDCFVFDFSQLASAAAELEPTKRHIVGIASKIYDPIGFVSPITIRFKILFQELCEAKMDWDEVLPTELLQKWHNLTVGLEDLQPIKIQRCYFTDGATRSNSTCSLQGFCDASEKAYAAVVYLRVTTDTHTSLAFVASKSRVSPVKGQSIPRLELLSALLLATLMDSVSSALDCELSLDQPTYYTDSQVALHWIKGQEKEWKPFVQNRVNQIRDLTSIDRWRHCPGRDNPADLPSRGVNPSELSDSKIWQHGPDWLYERDDKIPNTEDTTMPQECEVEKRVRKIHNHSLLVPSSVDSVQLKELIDCESFSSVNRLLRVTAYVLRFVSILKAKRQTRDTENHEIMITTTDLQVAETLWLKEVQASLVNQPGFKMWHQQFGLFLDGHGVWRCGGRLTNADIPPIAKNPILLNSQHYFTTLIVREAHSRVMHNGVKETLTELRSRYWIIRGRSFVRKLIHQCVICRRFEGGAHQPPPPPPLPECRVQRSPPFHYTGVDYAGPLYVKGGNKVWICL